MRRRFRSFKTSRTLPVLLLVTLVAAAVTGLACDEGPPSDVLRVSGHVEATEVYVAAEASGPLLELAVAEGDRVEAGTTLARLDTLDTELLLDRARAERGAAAAQLALLRAGARTEDVAQARAQVAAAEAEVTAVEAEVVAAARDLERFEGLLRANAGAAKPRDDARARLDGARARQRAAEARVQAALEALARLEAGNRREEVEAGRARVASADAQIAVLEKTLRDAEVVSRVSGVVTGTLVERGEIVARGMPLVVVTDLDRAWANLFVPEPMVPRVTIGQAATVLTDAPGVTLEGTVTYVSPNAEFTPRNVQTADERSKLVYRIKVTVDNREGILKPGMPVDAELALR
jgi:HlyD family secretion protein